MLWVSLSSLRPELLFPTSMRNILFERKFNGLDKKRTVWHLALLSLFWCLWSEHNPRIFNEEELSKQRLKEVFIKSFLEWSKASLQMKSFSMVLFLDSLFYE